MNNSKKILLSGTGDTVLALYNQLVERGLEVELVERIGELGKHRKKSFALMVAVWGGNELDVVPAYDIYRRGGMAVTFCLMMPAKQDEAKMEMPTLALRAKLGDIQYLKNGADDIEWALKRTDLVAA